MATRLRAFGMNSGPRHTVAVNERRDGKWIGSYGLKSSLDPYGASNKFDVFDTVEGALEFIGYPHSIVGIPTELK